MVFANFFFWKPGSVLQKSLTGLFRSLLHDTLKVCPELIPLVLPEQWNGIISTPWQLPEDFYLRNDHIRNAFSRLIVHRNLYKKHCFCFFIDGLDEYEETRQEDYKAMVELLSSWTLAAPEDVKICVSSREHNVFLNAFSKERRIHLQELTRRDMEFYVQDRLKDMSDTDERSRFMRKIVEKADGIFLWVALVTKSLREQLEDGCELFALERELDSLPDELEDLFKHLLILKPMNNLARKKAYQVLAIVLKLRNYDLYLSLFSYPFLDNYEKDPEFAMKSFLPDAVKNDTSRTSREELASKRLNRDCRGLLEPKPGRGETLVIEFTHRSVPEFLEKPNIKADMNIHLKDFSLEDAISQLFLAEIRSSNRDFTQDDLSLIAFAIIDLRRQINTDHAPFSFLEYLHSSMLGRGARMWPPNGIDYSKIKIQGIIGYVVGGRLSGKSFSITSPLHISAFLGHDEYVAWKIQHDPTVVGTDSKSGLLMCCISAGYHRTGKSKAYSLRNYC